MATAVVPVIYKREDLVHFLGFWFDRLGRHLLKSKLLSYDEWLVQKSRTPYDLYCEALCCCVEFKGSSSNNQMKLFDDQLEGQLKDLGFPYDDGFTWIFTYRNCERRNGKRVSLLKDKVKTPKDVTGFLASHTTVAYAIDTRLLDELRRFFGSKDYTRDKWRDRKIIFINRTNLREVAADLRKSLKEIGLEGEISRYLPPKARSTKSRFVKTRLDGQDVSFELIPLVPTSMKSRLLKKLNGAVVTRN